MTMKNFIQALGALFVSTTLFFASPSHAIVIWDESLDGDFSNNVVAPTDLLTLNLGSNLIVGSIGRSSSSDSKDVAMFTVPTGYVLSQVIFESYQHGVYYDYVPFSLHSGASTSDPMIEFILLTDWGAGTDLLQFDSRPGPQPAGIYTFKFGSIEQDTVVDERSLYSVNFNISPIPEPCTMLLVGSGILGVAGLRRRLR